jgi:hypothetical protein
MTAEKLHFCLGKLGSTAELSSSRTGVYSNIFLKLEVGIFMQHSSLIMNRFKIIRPCLGLDAFCAPSLCPRAQDFARGRYAPQFAPH